MAELYIVIALLKNSSSFAICKLYKAYANAVHSKASMDGIGFQPRVYMQLHQDLKTKSPKTQLLENSTFGTIGRMQRQHQSALENTNMFFW